jgi:hypothetical protein
MEAPKIIWIRSPLKLLSRKLVWKPELKENFQYIKEIDKERGDIEYIRKDIYDARLKALEEALEKKGD